MPVPSSYPSVARQRRDFETAAHAGSEARHAKGEITGKLRRISMGAAAVARWWMEHRGRWPAQALLHDASRSARRAKAAPVRAAAATDGHDRELSMGAKAKGWGNAGLVGDARDA